MHCIVAGASGLIGQRLLKDLVSDISVDFVTAVARGPLPLKHSKLEVIKASFEQLSGVSLPQADVAFCCLGTTIKKAGSKEAFYRVDHDYTLTFARSCHAAGVKIFVVVTAHGANPESKIYYNKVKGRTEMDLIDLNFERLIIVRPSLLLGKRTDPRPLEKAAQLVGHFLRPLMVGGLSDIRPVEAGRVAKCMKRAATTSNIEAVEVIRNRDI